MKVNKFLYGWKLYVDYGQGWEYECFYLTRKELKEDMKAYRENCQYPIKARRGRELNTKNWNRKQIGL